MKHLIAIFLLCTLYISAFEAVEPTTIILTRHGQTHWNAKGLWQGSRDTNLNLNGVNQAVEKAIRYQDEPIVAIYSSPRKRAYLTAQIIAAPHDIDVVADEGLAEPWLGKLEGMHKNDVNLLTAPVLDRLTQEERLNTGHLPGLISPKMVTARVEEVLRKIGTDHSGTVIAVSHSGIIAAILAVQANAIYESISMNNGAFLKFLYDGKQLSLIEISPDITYAAYPFQDAIK